MDELDRYGSPVHRYEGVGEVTYADGPPTPVYFDARQIDDGTVIVGCLSTGGFIGDRPTGITGRTVAGDRFWTSGDMTEVFLRAGGVNKAHYICREMRVSRAPTERTISPRVQFALHNFVFGQGEHAPRSPVSFEVDGLRVSLAAVDDYEPRLARLRRYGGIVHTAWCDVRSAQGPTHLISLAEAQEFMDRLVNPLSLALGTLVSWHHLTARDYFDQMTDIVHRSSIARPFSNLVVGRGWHVDAAAMVGAWFGADDGRVFPPEQLAIYIRQHLDACAHETFLETRALSAATLLDVMTGRYAQLTGTEDAVSPEHWQAVVLPGLHQALAGIPRLTQDQVGQIKASLEHQYRRSFKRKLKQLLDDLGMTPAINSKRRTAATNARNALVHYGRFHATDRGRQTAEFFNLLLLSRSSLLRLAGFPSDLHQLMTD